MNLKKEEKNRLLQQKIPNHEIYSKDDEQGSSEAGMGTSTSQKELIEKDILDVISMKTLKMKLLRKKCVQKRILERIKKKKQRLRMLVDHNRLNNHQITILNEELNRSIMRSASLVEVNLSSMRAVTLGTTLPVAEERHGCAEEQTAENSVVLQANIYEQNMEKSNEGDCDSDLLTVSTQTPLDETVEETSSQELRPISVKENNFKASETEDIHAGDHDLYTLQCMALKRQMELYEAQKELCKLEMAKTRNEIENCKRKHALEVDVLEAKKRKLEEESKLSLHRPVQQGFGPFSWS